VVRRYHAGSRGRAFALDVAMSMGHKLARYGGARLSRRLRRSIPFVGTAIAVLTVASTIRRKGVVSGTLDTGLNAMPIVGLVKNAIEVFRGRDYFPDRYPSGRYTADGRPGAKVSGR
jgi:hypothetical protein